MICRGKCLYADYLAIYSQLLEYCLSVLFSVHKTVSSPCSSSYTCTYILCDKWFNCDWFILLHK